MTTDNDEPECKVCFEIRDEELIGWVMRCGRAVPAGGEAIHSTTYERS